jgi:hypothetical protein
VHYSPMRKKLLHRNRSPKSKLLYLNILLDIPSNTLQSNEETPNSNKDTYIKAT